MNPERITIASIQPPFPQSKSSSENNQIIESGLAMTVEVIKKEVAFVCLPEYFNCYGVEACELPVTVKNWQSILDDLCRLAREYRSYIILPVIQPIEDAYRNRAYLINTQGEIAGFYDKTHITITEKQDMGIVAGDQVKTFDTEYGRVGIVICYDIYFPELFASLRRQRPDMIFFPSLQRSDHELANATLVQTRAMDTQAYIVRSSFGCPLDVPWTKDMMFGQSAVVHPDGTILANAGHYEGVALAHVTLPFTWQRTRCGGYGPMPVRDFLHEDGRPELYKP